VITVGFFFYFALLSFILMGMQLYVNGLVLKWCIQKFKFNSNLQIWIASLQDLNFTVYKISKRIELKIISTKTEIM